MTDTRNEFIIESREHLTHFERALLAIEKGGEGVPSGRIVDEALRAVHSLKGDSGLLGLTTLRNLAHAMESLLESYRDGVRLPSSPVIETLLAARDQLAILLEDLDHSNSVSIENILQRIAKHEERTVGWKVGLDLANTSSHSLLRFFQTIERLCRIQQPQLSFPRGLEDPDFSNLHTIGFEFEISELPPENERQFFNTLGLFKQGTVQSPEGKKWCCEQYDLSHVNLLPFLRDLNERCTDRGGHLSLPEHDLSHALPEGLVLWSGWVQNSTSIMPQGRTELPVSVQALASTKISEKTGASEIAQEIAGASDNSLESKKGPAILGATVSSSSSHTDSEKQRSLRINVELLDRLMNLVGELTLVRNQTQVTFREEEGEARNIIQRLNTVTTELQDTVLQTRMQPVGNLFGRFPRMVRDLARQLGKEIEIVMVGQEVELDKTVLERLSDPLTHLIRNSIDHGIELPEVREKVGKPRIGKITLSATPADGQVNIEIRDDGRGIDPDAVRTKARSMRLRNDLELERMNHRELFSLILLPGFSTAKQLTDVSGRGVGMDVVKTNIEELEGTLTIDSSQGRGTAMILRVPLTLAIVPCLIVTVGHDRFAVPQREVEEIVCLHPQSKERLEQAFDTEVYRLRDKLLPIVRLSEVLARPRPFSASDKAEMLVQYLPENRDPRLIDYILVVRTSGKRFGLLVDNVLGREEIVVKPLHAAMKQLKIFSGATLMGDGKVSLIANVEGIIDHARCFVVETESPLSDTIRNPHEVHRVLVFEYGPEEQFALPLVQVQRVEWMDMRRVERIGDREFVSISGVLTRILRLSDAMNVTSPVDGQHMFLILPKFVEEPMGILASRIIDTESLAIDLQSTHDERGVLGTAVVRDRLSLFLDIQELREYLFGTANPTRGSNRAVSLSSQSEQDLGVSSPQVVEKQRILLVDDTPFFREVVKRYLSNDQLVIETAIDGKDGLDKLSTSDYDLVVSDIEMPNMDGWQFCKLAREKGYQMPFIALTSLAKLEHEDKAAACGFDDFEEKLDHDRLKNKVADWLSRSRTRKANAGSVDS